MALKFKTQLKDSVKDVPPSTVKTVRRMIQTMKDLFFQESHDNIRNACSISLHEILENCFVNKRYGKDGSKPAKELIFDPIFEEI